MKNIKNISLVLVIGFAIAITVISCKSKTTVLDINGERFKGELIFAEDFNNGLEQWQVEQMPKGTVEIKNSKLEIDDVSGCTVWLKEKFSGPIMIEYDVFVIQDVLYASC